MIFLSWTAETLATRLADNQILETAGLDFTLYISWKLKSTKQTHCSGTESSDTYVVQQSFTCRKCSFRNYYGGNALVLTS